MRGSGLIADRFKILGVAGRGEMGEIRKARDEQTGAIVAVKTILSRRGGERVSLNGEDPNARRFEREVRIMSRLGSPHIPAIIDGGVDGDLPYLAMEYIDGVTLAELLAENDRELPLLRAVTIAEQIAEGLKVAHRAGVVHRDLKPANIMIANDEAVKVLDFGVGLILDDVDGGQRLTSSDMTIGTAKYMSPEQVQAKPVTPASDLYALGCVLYEMLVGTPPFDGENTYTLMNQQVSQQATPVLTLRHEVPEQLDLLVSRLLEKNPDDRPEDVDEVSLRLRLVRLDLEHTPEDTVFQEEDEDQEPEPPAATEIAAAVSEDFDIFAVHERLISDYRAFTEGAALIRDDRIAKLMEESLDKKEQWPDPWLSLNPFFADGGSVTDLVHNDVLHPECARIFQTGKRDGSVVCDGRPVSFYQHQRDAIAAAQDGLSYVLTTGTGSGKSLSYIVPIVDHALRAKESDRHARVRAIIVYPMNALANSQKGELEKFLRNGYPEGQPPVTFARYTGQESQADRDKIRANPPDILLTNYVMLELMLTRPGDRRSLIHMAEGLEFVVFDELHTYRGRQGADVAMLIRRLKDACAAPNVRCIGTSATMSTQGTPAQRRKVVADVATQIFGSAVLAENVIGETLVRGTDENVGPVTADRINAPVAPASYEDLVTDPVAAWVETNFGLDRDEEGRLVRRAPTTVQLAARQLAAETGATAEQCEKALQRTLQAGSRARHPVTDRPLFAFRLHQFLSKGDTVYVTIEDESSRGITRDYQVEQPRSGGKLLMPLAFCRECGQEYLSVWRRDTGGTFKYAARRNASMSGGDDSDGYLYISSDLAWPRDEETAISERRLPEAFLETSDRTGQDTVKPSARKYVPVPVTVDPYGTERPDANGSEAAFIPAPFRFCLRCGVSYEQVRGRDFAKLATIDQEGRSSATSLISTSIMRSLQAVPERALDRSARKLLTFVDNRQDASLQAGHFNDFIQVLMLRGAMYRAAARASEDGLFEDDIPSRVTTALGLDRSEYAREPGEDAAMAKRTAGALRDVVNLRVYLDLERGWRVTMPNLEQCGLLTIDYLGLDGIAANEELWRSTADTLRLAPPEAREKLCRVVLNEMRRSLAIDAECFDELEFDRIKRRSQSSLNEEWAIGDDDKPVVATIFAGSGRPGGPREHINMSGRGKVGKYIRRTTSWFPGYQQKITVDMATLAIVDLLHVLAAKGLLTKVEDRGKHGYRVRASAMTWHAGEGIEGAEDPLTRSFSGAEKPRANPYWVAMYRNVADELAGLSAREHTAQVPSQVRMEREEAFRKAELKLLYCSPTMELGVDIAGLNAVSMRNVPPTPANYAQRSGRAGRSGQPALVTTYCATGNSHDQYYFRKSDRMVAGAVAPPKLDLLNEDLVRSHVHSIWLAETQWRLGAQIQETIDLSGSEAEGKRRPDPVLKLNVDVAAAIESPEAGQRAVTRTQEVLRALEGDLAGTSWWYSGWIENVISKAPANFDHAFDRWRDLYRAALIDQFEQNRRRLDHSLSQRDRDRAAGRRREAETQLTLLLNEDTGARNLTSDFNPYRYLASEGFLPGYSFPRLPIAAYIPGGRTRNDGDYVQRSRFLAIKEFGPRALIYHEGKRFEVTRVQLPPDSAGEVVTFQARRCAGCGYHGEVGPGNDQCELCQAKTTQVMTSLLPLHTVFTTPRQRISSDEEERRRAGFKVVTSFRFADHGDRPGQLDALVNDALGEKVARLSFGDSATVRRINLGPSRRAENEPDGFRLDPGTGRWLNTNAGNGAQPPADDDDANDKDQAIRVIPYVEDRRNVLVLQLTEKVEVETALSVMYALERGIEAVFQLEDAELDSELLPPDEGPRDRMLFTESAEGGAGVLRRLQAEPDALARAAREALSIAHFNPDTGDNLGGPSPERLCEKGCYDCLLSYGNQLSHDLIDRRLAKALLMAMAHGRALTVSEGKSRTEQVEALKAQADSTLESRFAQWLKDNGYRLPDAGQTTVANAYARPDFVYYRPSGKVAVFIDGVAHDSGTVTRRDADAEERLADGGWLVIRVRHDDDWSRITEENPTVFGNGR